MQYIDWMLFSDEKLLICRKNQESKYIYKKELIYENEKEYNKFDLVKNIFTRKTDDLKMEINFRDKMCTLDFGEEGNCKFDIECEWNYKNDILVLSYSIDETKKIVKVIFKELIL